MWRSQDHNSDHICNYFRFWLSSHGKNIKLRHSTRELLIACIFYEFVGLFLTFRMRFLGVTYLSQISFGIITSSLSSHVFVPGFSWLIRLRLLDRYLKIVSRRLGFSPSRKSCSLRRTRWLQIIFLACCDLFSKFIISFCCCFDANVEQKWLHFLFLFFSIFPLPHLSLFIFLFIAFRKKFTFDFFWLKVTKSCETFHNIWKTLIQKIFLNHSRMMWNSQEISFYFAILRSIIQKSAVHCCFCSLLLLRIDFISTFETLLFTRKSQECRHLIANDCCDANLWRFLKSSRRKCSKIYFSTFFPRNFLHLSTDFLRWNFASFERISRDILHRYLM